MAESHEIDRSLKLKISAGVNGKWLTKEKRKSIKYVHHRRRLYKTRNSLPLKVTHRKLL